MKKTRVMKKNYEFKYVLKNGRYFSGKNIEVFYLKNNSITNQIGIAVSKKVGNSVVRNRLKRLIRENYRLYEDKLDTGYSIVFLWKKKADTTKATFKLVEQDFESIFSKI